MFCIRFVAGVVTLLACLSLSAAGPEPLKLLFLGDNGHHQPARRFQQLAEALAPRGIELYYSDRPQDLNLDRLHQYAGLVVYANIDTIEPDQAQALLAYVASGKGFIPLHCASYCFRNSEEVVALIGAQFQRHGTGTFRVTRTEAGAAHPLMRGYGGFESWDETYVHTRHNEQNRIVLEYRQEGDQREPWTWVRTHGDGRVFYTAWGHDERTFGHPGFHNLVERGIRWACGQDVGQVPAFADRPEMTPRRTDVKPFEYVDAVIPFYPPSQRWGTQADPVTKLQKPLSPEESLKHFVTPVGFHVELFASEPDIGKPLAMNWDERGRLWLCETLDYPNELQEPGQGRDRIRICEDTNGDGRADKFTTFAEKLSIPTAIAFYRGGALVQDGVRTLYLKDTDGDDRADLQKTLVTGWAMNDTHGGVSNFRYGFDNWYYAMQGYNNSEPVLTDGRRVQPFRMGFFRFKVEGDGEATAVTDIEFLRSTNNNTWGLGLSEEGIIFGSTANGNPSEYLPIPNRYYEKVRGWSASVLNGIAGSDRIDPLSDKVRQVDHHGGFTAAAGHALYTARAWPQEYWNRTAFVCEPTAKLVATFVFTPDGAGFRSKNRWNILASDDEWSAPIMAEVGPDGQLWVIDWYNIIVQHNPTPAGYKTGKGNAYEIDLRDKSHGRIYRVVHGAQSPPIPRLGTSPSELVATLKGDNLLWRAHAQRLLVERGKLDIATDLVKLATDQSCDETGLNVGAIHAIWALHGLQSGNDSGESQRTLAELQGASGHASAGVRKSLMNAFHVVAAESTYDVDPQVRLAAFLALADSSPRKESGELLAVAAFRPDVLRDPWLRDALSSAAAQQHRFFLPAAAQIETIQVAGPPASSEARTSPRDVRLQTEAAHATAETRAIIRRVAEHLARTGSIDAISELVRQLGAEEQPRQTAAVEEMLAGLVEGWPRNVRAEIDAETDAALVKLIDRVPTAGRANLVQLASRLGSKQLERYVNEIASSLLAAASDESLADEGRANAALQLVGFRKSDADTAIQLLELITPRTSPELGAGLVNALRQSEATETGSALAERLPSLTPNLRAAGISALLERAEWTVALLDAVEAGQLQLSDLTLDQKQSLASHPNERIAARVKPLLDKGGGLPNPDRQVVIDELLPVVAQPGDAVAGKEVFKKTCAKCHTHSGEGTRIGPDLTGMAVHPKHELLVQILDPSRSVEGNFRIYTVLTADGLVLNGLLQSESKTALELVDAEAKKHTILREDIDEMIASRKSLMPEGFEKQHTPTELRDLLEFLTLKGKYLPIPLDKFATVVTTLGMFNSKDAPVERLIFRDWTPKLLGEVPFVLVDPQGTRVPNAIMLHGTHGGIPPTMPKSVTLPCNTAAKSIHLLSGVSGWGYPASEKGTTTMIVRLHYAGGRTEDHPLLNGEHFADYIRRVDVPGSTFAFSLRGRQIRHIAVHPKTSDVIEKIELVKGRDVTSPVVMAVTVENL